MTDSNDNWYDGAFGFCIECGEEGKARSEDADGNPLSDCCLARISRDPITWNLTLITDLGPVAHKNYEDSEAAYFSGDRLKLLYPWVKDFRVEKCISETTAPYEPVECDCSRTVDSSRGSDDTTTDEVSSLDSELIEECFLRR